MAFKIKEKSELKEFSKLFFSIINEFASVKQVRVNEIHNLLTQIAEICGGEKELLCQRVHELSAKECEQLTTLVEIEEDIQYVIRCFQSLEVKDFADTSLLENYFSIMQRIVYKSYPYWHEEEEIENKLTEYLRILIEDFEKILKSYEKYLLTKVEWPDCPAGVITDSPIQIYDDYMRLQLLHKRELIQRIIRCLRKNEKRWLFASENWMFVEADLVYFTDLLKEDVG